MPELEVKPRIQLAEFWPSASDQPGPFPVSISDRSLCGILNLRGNPDDGNFFSAVGGVLGGGLPVHANTTAMGNRCRICWLGPDEWLIVGSEVDIEKFHRKLESELNCNYSATVLTGAYQRLRIEGVKTRELLSKGCPLDLHPTLFGTGRCAQTRLARAIVIIIRISEQPAFDIFVRRSFADYLAMWLINAAREFGFTGNGSTVFSQEDNQTF